MPVCNIISILVTMQVTLAPACEPDLNPAVSLTRLQSSAEEDDRRQLLQFLVPLKAGWTQIKTAPRHERCLLADCHSDAGYHMSSGFHVGHNFAVNVL